MKIAFIGSRGIPARYSGFETFYEQLGTRLADRGHEVTVYNRSHFIKDVKDEYRGVRLVSLPCIQSKHLETISHTFVSTCHALFQRYDIAYYCIVGNAPLVWLPRVFGTRTLLNVDGADWAREKWGTFARWYQKLSERVATRTPSVVIADAKAIQARYRGEYSAETIFAPYGGNIVTDDAADELARWQLVPDEYILYVGRFVPENAIHTLIEAFAGVKTNKRLVIVGDAPYADEYNKRLRAMADDRVVFTGYVFGRTYTQLSRHAYLYVQPSAVNGTRPALLDQLGFANCVLVCNSAVNMEVISDCGTSFDGNNAIASLRDGLQQLVGNPTQVDVYRKKAVSRVEAFYNWEKVTDFYETLFSNIVEHRPLTSYDEFLSATDDTDSRSC